ncbi:putative non-F420 flavinoid oxidoreductase [Candidatus Methanoperedens nitroreducens]|uniref:Putative non-F420 flavinoid oxidoreductase n=1 Tax=Candidatus Methanoperedens nitratireducens TaxID=1392998 RepID=A0A062V9L2_9EURY|nr:TIGR03885 family FMN-dependent LLM class oxidoreductase [Candidatus Methanoperedens nitroreducens]KCZ73243.1 putative non-F420 flavinoid oxidoreductase [Candidatus Methanoperedens nitroreducens]MDJ1422811.1 TIGR03885 family FMN-dependent LLM class oxidoreductase [Candidatus Methanoperedens sp.]
MKIGYHASHEQFKPGVLLELARAAEAAGFNAAMCSDHFYPWSESQGESGFAWSWLGAALQATSLPFGVVTAPGQRYNPAILAQASATLLEMFPGRFWPGLGSGELLNEAITGDCWPPASERNKRLRESAQIMRALWAGEKVTHYGRVVVEEAKLYTRPSNPPLLIGAAISPETAQWLGEWADGLITISRPEDELKEVVEAFHSGGGEGKPMYLKVQVSYARTDEEALQGAWEQWRTAILGSSVLADLRFPEQLEAAAKYIKPEDMYDHVRISSDTDKHIEWLRDDIRLGFEHIYLHNVNRGQQLFIKDFGERVLPALAEFMGE